MKINTNTLLLAGGAAVALYLLTRPTTPAVNPYLTQPVYNPYANTSLINQNQTAQDIAAGGTALNALSNLLGNFF